MIIEQLIKEYRVWEETELVKLEINWFVMKKSQDWVYYILNKKRVWETVNVTFDAFIRVYLNKNQSTWEMSKPSS